MTSFDEESIQLLYVQPINWKYIKTNVPVGHLIL